MKAQRNQYGQYIVTEGANRYKEVDQAVPSSRLLDGSQDHGYWAEYVGHGTIDDIPVKAIYLLDHNQKEIEDEGDFDWDGALANGRLIVDVDKLSDTQYETLTVNGAL